MLDAPFSKLLWYDTPVRKPNECLRPVKIVPVFCRIISRADEDVDAGSYRDWVLVPEAVQAERI